MAAGLGLSSVALAQKAAPIITTEANLPATCEPGQPFIVTDGADASDCVTGLGSVSVLCTCDSGGASYSATGDGNSGGTPTQIVAGDSDMTVADAGAGTITATVDTSAVGVWTVGGLTIGGADVTDTLVLPLSNDDATPTLAFGNGNTGFYESSDDVLQISVGGNVRWAFTGNSFQGTSTNGPALIANGTAPTIRPSRADADSGLSFVSANVFDLEAGNVTTVRINTAASGVNYINVTPAATGVGPTIASAGEANVPLILAPAGTGKLTLSGYGSGGKTGTDAFWLAVDSSGNVIEEAIPGGGLTLTGVTNGLLLYDNADALGGISQLTYDGTNLTMTPTSGDDIQAEEVVGEIYNNSGATIFKCAAVYISGFNVGADLAEVSVADADDPAKMPAIGLVRSDITTGSAGFVVTAGDLINADTTVSEVWAAGGAAYVNTSGTSTSSDCGDTLTETKPTGTAEIQKMALVTRVNAANGELELTGAGRANDVPNITSANFWLGNGSGVATAVAMSSEATMDNAGAVTIAGTHAGDTHAADNLGDDLITALSGVTTVTDGAICEGGAASTMDCDLASSGTGNVARVDSPVFTTAVTVPAGSISAGEIETAPAISGANIDSFPQTQSKSLFDSTNLTATDDIPDLWRFSQASTVTAAKCISTGGTSITVTVEDDTGNDLTTSCVCATTLTTCSLTANVTFTADERADWTTVSVSGSVTSATMFLDYDYD